ncbi:NAD-dependent protein deacetylase sirtuin-7-like [Clavelina lepadiformis]|uniref:Regulatory protein SIR2 homolog 7 n=1 Tax=Clavelina lepadiformis TaxID=159417 RepID=A0ABP0G2Y9_CLALP
MENDDVFEETLLNPSDRKIDPGCIVDSLVVVSDCRTLRPRKYSETLSQNDITKKIRAVVRQAHRSADDEIFLEQHESLVKLIESRRSSYDKLKERAKEVLDDPLILDVKVAQLTNILRASKHAIIYTGAGISTSADIPAYRGIGGVWTQLNAGHNVVMNRSLAHATPTFTHMAITALVKQGMVKYVVSQNCDGLHVRSGIPPANLSEIHGNMFAENCSQCSRNFYRVFDVTEETGLRRHFTKRFCDQCKGKLKDTIVHFGELSHPRWPHNWEQAESQAEKSDLILCLGSSLKVFRSYKKLWLTDRKKCLRPKLCIINIQWTPKDSQACLKINGRTDEVMENVMKHLNIEVKPYVGDLDPIFQLAVPTAQLGKYRSQCIPIPATFKSKFPEIDEAVYKEPKLENTALETSSAVNPPSTSYISDETCSVSEEDPASSLASPVLQIREGSERDLTSPSSVNIPAWFGKGRKRTKTKRGGGKRRRKAS